MHNKDIFFCPNKAKLPTLLRYDNDWFSSYAGMHKGEKKKKEREKTAVFYPSIAAWQKIDPEHSIQR